MHVAFALAGTIIGAYLLGSISFGLIFARLFAHTDVRDLGSGNTGMTNVLRSIGLVPGILTGLGDFAKGVGAVWLGYWLFGLAGLDPSVGKYVGAAFVLVGHLFPVFFGFRGGKGVMTSGAVILMLDIYMALPIVVIFFIAFACCRIVSLSVLIAITPMPVITLGLALVRHTEMLYSTIFSAMIMVLLYITLRENVKRLRAGTEKKLVIKLPGRPPQKDKTEDLSES